MPVFLLHMSHFPAAMAHIEKKLPWKLISIMLNGLRDATGYRPKPEDDDDGENPFAAPKNDSHRPLPDGYVLQGLIFSEEHLPKSRFHKDFDEDEKYIGLSSLAEDRVKRILWIGSKIAQSTTWLIWDACNNEFGTALEYGVEVEEGHAPLMLHTRKSSGEFSGDQV